MKSTPNNHPMRHRHTTTGEGGLPPIRTWEEGSRPKFRVELVCDARNSRRVFAEYGTLAEAESFAEWFGTTGNLRAEVSEIPPAVDAESFYQLSIVYPDGSEEISERCVAGDIAAMQIEFFNAFRPVTRRGRTMVARLLEPPRLASAS